ncbi:MAG: hypothetical protein Q4C99_07815 [Clostridia bacterium]|nr:hypothetical protein [Clostridia bacterium]
MNKVVSVILLFVLLISLFAIPAGIHYIDMSYPLAFDEPIKYKDIFFETNACDYSIYGIGSYDIYTDRLIEKELSVNNGELPHSETKAYCEKRGIEIYLESLIERRNEILSKCSFKMVDSDKAFGLSFLFNYLNNITTIKISDCYLEPGKDNARFSKDILQDLLDKEKGIINAGVFSLFSKTYLMADFALFDEKSFENYKYKDNVSVKKIVFEILPSEEASELVDRKYSSQAGIRDSYKASPIGVWNVLVFLVGLIVVLKRKKLYSLVSSKRSVFRKKCDQKS